VTPRDHLADHPDTLTGERAVYYDAGMLIALLDKETRARATHEALKASPHRPIITGPVLAQVWRDGPATVHTLNGIVRDCTILQAKDDPGPIRGLEEGIIGCLPCHRVYRRADFQRAGKMLGKADLPAKKKPDAVDALIIAAAAWHGPSLILTTDEGDLTAYRAALDIHQIDILPIG
jgi:predicted nucleic acid-binding protein